MPATLPLPRTQLGAVRFRDPTVNARQPDDATSPAERYTSAAMTSEHSPSSPRRDTLTRRALLGAAAAGATTLAYGRLPAWAKPVAAASGVRRPDTLPFPH